jgi:hypothetical protein
MINCEHKQEYTNKEPSIPALRKKRAPESACVKHAPSPGTPLAMDDLHELRLAPSETREKWCSPHTHKIEDLNRRRVRVTHWSETNHKASLSDHPDQKRPATAPRQFLLEKIQSRIKDRTWNISPPKIHQHPPFFTDQHLKITACNKKTIGFKKNIYCWRIRKTQQPPSVEAPGGSKTSTA